MDIKFLNKISEIMNDFGDEITRKTLIDSYNSLLEDYKYPANKIVPIFSYDDVEENKKIRKLLKSMYRVIDWFSTPNEISTLEKIDD